MAFVSHAPSRKLPNPMQNPANLSQNRKLASFFDFPMVNNNTYRYQIYLWKFNTTSQFPQEFTFRKSLLISHARTRVLYRFHLATNLPCFYSLTITNTHSSIYIYIYRLKAKWIFFEPKHHYLRMVKQ